MIRSWIRTTLLILLVVQPGCRKTEQVDKPTIAFVMKTLNNPFFIDMQKGAESAAQQLGVELTVQAASAKSTSRSRCKSWRI